MRKISKSRSAIDRQSPADDNRLDERPRGISGATITSWNGSPEIDLDALFAGSANGPTVAGAAPVGVRDRETVALSDGTRITFSDPKQFKCVTTV
jgi:hypothetical protein